MDRRNSPAPPESPERRDTLWVVADLAVVAVAAVATVALAVGFGRADGPAFLRVPLGFLFVFLLPGYALTSALFPGRDVQLSGTLASGRQITVNGVERLALSVGLSIFLVPLVSLALTLVGQRIAMVPVLGAIAAVIVGTAAAGAVRRLRHPAHRRWRPPVGASKRWTVEYVTASRLNLILAVLVVVAAAGVGAAVVVPDNGERYTEFGLLAPGDDGEPVAARYQTEFAQDEQPTFLVEIANREGRSVDYTVVTVLWDVNRINGTWRKTQATELNRTEVRLAAGERTRYRHQVRVPFAGDPLRLTYLLYRGDTPENPQTGNAYRSTELTVTVTDGGQ